MDTPKIPERPRKSQGSPAPSANPRSGSSDSVPQIPALRPRPKTQPYSTSADNTDTDTNTSHSIPSPATDKANIQFPTASIAGDDGETTPGNTNVRATLKMPNDESDQFDDDADTIAISEDVSQSIAQSEAVPTSVISDRSAGTSIEELESLSQAEGRKDSGNGKNEYFADNEVHEMTEKLTPSEDVVIPSRRPEHVLSETSETVESAAERDTPANSKDDDEPSLAVAREESSDLKVVIQPEEDEKRILEEPKHDSEVNKPPQPSIPVRPIKRHPAVEEMAVSRAADEDEASLLNASESLIPKNSIGSEEYNSGLEEARSEENTGSEHGVGSETRNFNDLHVISNESHKGNVVSAEIHEEALATFNGEESSPLEVKTEAEANETGGNELPSTDTEERASGAGQDHSEENVAPEISNEEKITSSSEIVATEDSKSQSSAKTEPDITKTTPTIPSRPARPARTSLPLDAHPKKAVPPPKPKKLLSKIAAFQQMFNQPEQAASAPQSSGGVPSSRSKLNSDHMGFAANLQNVVGRGIALPGMGGAVNPEILKKLSPAEENTREEKETDEPKVPTRRVRGPRGKKLPKSIENSDLKLELRFKVFANELWEVRLSKTKDLNDEAVAGYPESESDVTASTTTDAKQEEGADSNNKATENEAEPSVEESPSELVQLSEAAELVTTRESDHNDPAVVSEHDAPSLTFDDIPESQPAEVEVINAVEKEKAHCSALAEDDLSAQTEAAIVPDEPEIPGSFDVNDSTPHAEHPTTHQDSNQPSLLPESEAPGMDDQSQHARKTDLDQEFLEAVELSVAELQDYVGQHGNKVARDDVFEERAD